TLAEIPGHGRDKINSACALGGPELAREAVSRLLGVEVDRYLAFRWEGFVRAVDFLGGVELEVESDMRHHDSSAGALSEIDLRAGHQRLDGLRALQYARWRGDGRGDIGRVERQQKLLKALAAQALRPENLPRLPLVAAEVLRCCDTDLPATETLALLGAALARGIPAIGVATLPGRAETIGGVSYWVVEGREAKQFAENFLYGLGADAARPSHSNISPVSGGQV
ncbi:LCP family protein, partial [Desulfovirgula thermocuniculi]|uniref:LCP family protein n=1 Tax=Desulfovirgula thermocuniculi TaxID=348842 RepID=UPI001B7F95AB